jgi:hypothetical protein
MVTQILLPSGTVDSGVKWQHLLAGFAAAVIFSDKTCQLVPFGTLIKSAGCREVTIDLSLGWAVSRVAALIEIRSWAAFWQWTNVTIGGGMKADLDACCVREARRILSPHQATPRVWPGRFQKIAVPSGILTAALLMILNLELRPGLQCLMEQAPKKRNVRMAGANKYLALMSQDNIG